MTIRQHILKAIIFFTAVVLLVGCHTTLQQASLSPTATPSFGPKLSPTLSATLPAWGPMPTRIPSPTPTSVASQPLQILQAALRRGAYDEAATTWEGTHALAPQDGIVWREGARLAMAQGNVLSPTNSTLLDSTLSADSALSTTTTLPPTNSLATAEARIWQAIRLIPQDGETWALLGLILKKQGRFKAAMQALEVARTLDPTLGAGLFPALWQAALQAEDVQTLQALVRTYSQAHRETPLAIYYRAETLLTLGEVELARDLLIASMDQASPAILWYTLGRAYVRLEAWHEAALSLEVAKKRIAAGDDSLRFMDGEHTLEDLNLALGQAYLRAGQCAEAAPILRQMSASYPDLAPLVREAVLCQTPTPTWTPWMLSEQVTPTFTPG